MGANGPGEQPVRVLRVIARMNVGGPALQVVELCRNLDPERYDTRLLVGAVDASEADYLELRAPDVAAVRVPGLGRELGPGDVRALPAIVREMRRFRPHIVHTHTAKAGVLGRVAARLARVPATVHTFHGHLLRGYFSPRGTATIVRVERTLARRTTRLVAVGAQVRDDLIGAGIGARQQYTVVPPGVRLPEPPPRAQARAELGIPADAKVVGFVGRLTAVKRPDRLAEVFRLVAHVHPDARLFVAGEGELLGELRAALAPVEGRVHFLGWQSDVGRLYSAADVVLLTSDNEGMPVSLIEAATCGRPAVTTDVGSAGEVVIDGVTGYVTPLDPGRLADAVNTLLADDAGRKAMGAAATRHAQQHFSGDRLVADIDALYQDVLREVPLR